MAQASGNKDLATWANSYSVAYIAKVKLLLGEDVEDKGRPRYFIELSGRGEMLTLDLPTFLATGTQRSSCAALPRPIRYGLWVQRSPPRRLGKSSSNAGLTLRA